MQNKDTTRKESAWETHDIGVQGITCDHCVRKVEKALRSKRGVKEVRVDRATARARVTFDSTETDIPALYAALLQSGYTPAPAPE